MEETGLEGRFRDLSALEDAEGEAINGAMIAARAEEDEAMAVRLLRSEGYYDAVASSAIEQLPDQAGRLRVTITVAPGNRYNFGAIAITGPDTEPPGMPRTFLPLEPGAPIRAVDVEAAEANVLLRLPQQGYPFPELGLRDIVLDPDDPARRLYAAGDAGPARALRRLHHRGRPRLRRRAMSACSPASAAASSTTAARSTICARRWSRPACSARSRPSRC